MSHNLGFTMQILPSAQRCHSWPHATAGRSGEIGRTLIAAIGKPLGYSTANLNGTASTSEGSSAAWPVQVINPFDRLGSNSGNAARIRLYSRTSRAGSASNQDL